MIPNKEISGTFYLDSPANILLYLSSSHLTNYSAFQTSEWFIALTLVFPYIKYSSILRGLLVIGSKIPITYLFCLISFYC